MINCYPNLRVKISCHEDSPGAADFILKRIFFDMPPNLSARQIDSKGGERGRIRARGYSFLAANLADLQAKTNLLFALAEVLYRFLSPLICLSCFKQVSGFKLSQRPSITLTLRVSQTR